MEQDLSQQAAYKVCEGSTDRKNNGIAEFATEAHTMIDIVNADNWDEDKLRI